MNIIFFLKRLYAARKIFRRFFPLKQELAYCGKNSVIEYPVWFECKKNIYIEDNVKIRALSHFINSPNEKIIIKKYTVIASNCTIITNNHRSTTQIPQFLLGESHINDKSNDCTINEDIWIGANSTIMSCVDIGRGAIIGANSLVTKSVPPYAVMVGSPAKIVAVKFSLEQILEHESTLYKEEERFSRTYLENLFEMHFKDKKVFGVTNNTTEKELEKIYQIKRQRNFKEPY